MPTPPFKLPTPQWLTSRPGPQVTNRFGSSCSTCISEEDWDYTPTCEEWAVIRNYNMRTDSSESGKGMAHVLPWFKLMSGLQDGLWATAIGWTVLTIMLKIRFTNARKIAQNKGPEFNNTVQYDELEYLHWLRHQLTPPSPLTSFCQRRDHRATHLVALGRCRSPRRPRTHSNQPTHAPSFTGIVNPPPRT